MRPEAENLFHELVGLDPAQREQFLLNHQVAADLRAEVETLLRFDTASDHVITGSVAAATEQFLSLPHVGDRCGPYRLVRLLGRGGMGSVYLAERADGEVHHKVAIKLLRHGGDEPFFRDRFLRERQILATLTHPGITGLIDAGHTRHGQPYLAMDYVDGQPIDVYARTLDLRARLALFIRVGEAVSYAHRNLIVHRDIKPSNILVDPSGEPKLLDFGIAKLIEPEGEPGAVAEITREGGGALTPEYAAPEQVTGGPITTATDVYALGVLLFVLLTDRHPAGPRPHSQAEMFKFAVDEEPPRASDTVDSKKLRQAIRGDLDTIVAKALKKNPQKRYLSVAELVDDVSRYLAHRPISARPDAFHYRAAKFVRRNRTAVAFGSLAFLATIAGVAGTLLQARAVRAQRDFALRQVSRAEAINDLNSFLLSDAAPSGKRFTVEELLRRAEHVVERQRDKDNANRVELLISIGRQYDLQDEDADARRVLEQAYRLSRQLPDPSARAKASCAFAAVLARGGELPRAEKLIEEGLGELPDQPQFALDRMFCLSRGSAVASEGGRAKDTIAREEAAQRVLQRSGFHSEFRELNVLMDLAEAYRRGGRQSQAVVLFEQAADRLAALGRDDTETAGTLFNNWALALSQLGQPVKAEKIFRRAIDVSRDDRGEQVVSPMLLINYARTLSDLGRQKEAADYAERGYAKALQAGDQVIVNQSLLLRCGIYRAQGNAARAEQMLSEVEPRLRHDLPPGHLAFASLTSEHAMNARAAGNLNTALELSNQALASLEASVKVGGQGAEGLPTFLIRRADLELQLGRKDDAAADANRGVNLLVKTSPTGIFSSRIGRAYFVLARALQAQGRLMEAQNAAKSAAEHFHYALGDDHEDARAALQLSGANPLVPAP